MEKKIAKAMSMNDLRNYVETVMYDTITNITGITNEEIASKIKRFYSPYREWTKEELVLKDCSLLFPLRSVNDHRKPYELEDFFPQMIEDLKNTNIDFGISKIEFCCFDLIFDKGIWYCNKNNVTVIPCCAWDDKEIPVNFVIYVDTNNQLRAYVPTNGNTYNKEFNCSYSRVWEHAEGKLSDEEIDEIESKGYEGCNLKLIMKDIFENIVAE